MANDRIYLKCRGCGATRSLAKYYPTLGYGVWWPDEVAQWIDKHMRCSPHFGEKDLNGDRCFDLFTESDPPSKKEENSMPSWRPPGVWPHG